MRIALYTSFQNNRHDHNLHHHNESETNQPQTTNKTSSACRNVNKCLLVVLTINGRNKKTLKKAFLVFVTTIMKVSPTF